MVCTALDKADITAVLTGGAATMLYAGDMQPSDDVDFIIRFGADKAANAVMKTLGFSRSGRIFISETTQFTVEFPPGPLAVGSEVIGTWETRKRCDECLYVISAFDAVRDRLCWYFYNDDFSSLAAAVAIASSHDVDVAAIGEWAEREYARVGRTIKSKRRSTLGVAATLSGRTTRILRDRRIVRKARTTTFWSRLNFALLASGVKRPLGLSKLLGRRCGIEEHEIASTPLSRPRRLSSGASLDARRARIHVAETRRRRGCARDRLSGKSAWRHSHRRLARRRGAAWIARHALRETCNATDRAARYGASGGSASSSFARLKIASNIGRVNLPVFVF